MRKIKLICKFVGIVAVMTAFVLECDAQQYDINVPNTNYVPSAQSWSFVKYGGTPVDLYTGTARVDIPIYTYSDPDFSIPISVGFASNGFIPFRHTGVVGLNWFLSAGGIITREIRGIDDVQSDQNTVLAQNVTGYGFEVVRQYSDEALLNNIYIGNHNYLWYYTLEGAETEADIYHFNFMGHFGSFHFNRKGEPKVYNTDGNNGIYHIKFGKDSSGNKNYKEIIINTGDGYTYTFGGENNYLEEHISGYLTHKFSDYSFNSNNNSLVSWMLREIKAPNGRTVKFYYGPTRSNIQVTRSQDETSPTHGNMIITEVQDVDGRIVELDASGSSVGLDGHTRYFYSKRRLNVLRTTYLEKIKIEDTDSTVINFNYSFKESKEISIGNANDIYDNPYGQFIQRLKKLDSISVTYKGTILAKSKFNYRKRPNNNKGDFRTILESVQVRGTGMYKMEYYEDHPYPDLSSSAQDFWGYANGATNDYRSVSPVMSNIRNDEIINKDYKYSNAEYSIIGNLRKITYPTGGYTEFEYEGNNVSKGVFKIYKEIPFAQDDSGFAEYEEHDPSNPQHSPTGGGTSAGGGNFLADIYSVKTEVGGVRIRRITDYDGLGGISTRVYDYNVQDDYSDGILLSFPRYHRLSFFSTYKSEDSSHGEATIPVETSVPTLISFPSNTFDKSHIEYRSVRETFTDGSSVEYYYNNYLINPDEYEQQDSIDLSNYLNSLESSNSMEQARYFSDRSIRQLAESTGLNYIALKTFFTNFYRVPNSHHLERGKLMKKIFYNAEGVPIRKEDYDYSRANDNCTVLVVISGQVCWSSKTYTGDYRMVSSRNVDYFYKPNSVDSLVSTTNLEYNLAGQVNKVTDTLTNGSIMTKRISYYPSELYRTYISRVLNTIDSPEKVVSEQLMQYAPISNSSSHIKPDKYFNSELLEPILYSSIIEKSPINQLPGIDLPPAITDSIPTIISAIAEITYKYDSNHLSRRLQETVDRNGTPTSYIWGYGGLYVVAVVKNVPYNQLPQSITSTSIVEGLSTQQESELRAIPNAEITTMKYEPFVGVTEIIEPSRRRLTYTYTTTGKLSHITDEDGNIINEYQYSTEQ